MVKLGQSTRQIASGEDGFTLAEFSVSIAIFSIVSAGLMMGFTSLERSYSATTAFTVNHADQMRISDSLAMDLRRAVAVQAAQNDTSIYIPTYYDPTDDKIPLLPALDGAGGTFYTATDMTGKTIQTGSGSPAPTLGNNGEYYVERTPAPTPPAQPAPPVYALYGPKTGGAWGNGTPLSVKVHYYLLAGCIYRQQGNKPPVVLADNVQGFIFNVTDVGKVVNTSITFQPKFNSSGASAAATAATTFYNTTLLRNTRTDTLSGVY
ncbi:MAG: prepilin-type N-terminal cleavage/methylation domain-containing protein [Chthoniobacterales bacterium]